MLSARPGGFGSSRLISGGAQSLRLFFFAAPPAFFFLLIPEPLLVGTAHAGRGSVTMTEVIIHNDAYKKLIDDYCS
jgi:hypothetical protein